MITKLRLRCMAIAMFIGVCGAFAQTADFSGTFGGTTIGDGSVYTFPTGAEGWAGFANNNTALYPLSFSEDGGIAFTAAAPNGDVNIKFKFEFKPHPDIEPSYTTEDILISGADEGSYSVAVPAQGDKTFSSLLMYVVERDLGVTVKDVVVTADELVTPVDGGSDESSSDVEGCLDANASNYNADATVQGLDQYGNLACDYSSCDDIPDAEGCFYANNYSAFTCRL